MLLYQTVQVANATKHLLALGNGVSLMVRTLSNMVTARPDVAICSCRAV